MKIRLILLLFISINSTLFAQIDTVSLNIFNQIINFNDTMNSISYDVELELKNNLDSVYGFQAHIYQRKNPKSYNDLRKDFLVELIAGDEHSFKLISYSDKLLITKNDTNLVFVDSSSNVQSVKQGFFNFAINIPFSNSQTTYYSDKFLIENTLTKLASCEYNIEYPNHQCLSVIPNNKNIVEIHQWIIDTTNFELAGFNNILLNDSINQELSVRFKNIIWNESLNDSLFMLHDSVDYIFHDINKR